MASNLEWLKAVINSIINRNYCTSIMRKMCAWEKHRHDYLYMHACIYLCILLWMPWINGDQSTYTCPHLPQSENMFLRDLHSVTLKLSAYVKWKRELKQLTRTFRSKLLWYGFLKHPDNWNQRTWNRSYPDNHLNSLFSFVALT